LAKARMITQADAIAYLRYARFDITEADIPAVLMDMVRVETSTWLIRRKVRFSALEDLDDDLLFIWAASFCLLLEKMAMRGQIQQSSGDVASTKTGDMQVMFQRWQPMFFFAKGMALGFYDLLPHMTYNMMAMQMLRSFSSWKFMKDHPNETAWGTGAAHINADGSLHYVAVMGTITPTPEPSPAIDEDTPSEEG